MIVYIFYYIRKNFHFMLFALHLFKNDDIYFYINSKIENTINLCGQSIQLQITVIINNR
jgi:hypothetical protein